jgi:hypothetical protein
MDSLRLAANALGAVGLFMLALKTQDKFWRTTGFVLAALNLLVVLARLFVNG